MFVLRLASKEIAKIKAEDGEILLKIEKHNDVIYCYRKDNNEFVGQGATLEEVAEQFKKKYPSNDARILKEDTDGLMP
jgi:phosphosulfolactate phosphohydrolase-like enzyme